MGRSERVTFGAVGLRKAGSTLKHSRDMTFHRSLLKVIEAEQKQTAHELKLQGLREQERALQVMLMCARPCPAANSCDLTRST